MNKLSGYKAFTLPDGTEIELKFGMGALELFGKSIGAKTVDEAMTQLNVSNDENGQPVVTFEFLGVVRKLLFAAAQFAALSQGKPVTFNEYQVSDWIDAVGLEEILSVLDLPDAAPDSDGAKKKKMKDRIRPTQ
ncbi:hypothetical protein [Spirosoma sp. 209]|uniref:hypothetical protein n=1 Tax=Spirosoma sp. 209 TaxID=1955701 RepID=UPI00098D2F4A|nr:hypothetical protein [Spirosoma sp. 209]